ncbi:MAG: UDP-N-acetylmuramate dehydrogenase [Spirochaetaceae bacterium]|jgi:UDP-N-acetylmuramate dehydrogenase|nr:UDP-N-acetylmuramate dehydrogenase [Spirochaetaceae bacterium]
MIPAKYSFTKSFPRGLFTVRYDEPMSVHTTFRTGGPADVYVKLKPAVPYSRDRLAAAFAELLGCARGAGVPVQIVGGGANIVVADAGIRGITLDTGVDGAPAGFIDLDSSRILNVYAGIQSDAAAQFAMENSLSGLEFLAALPGTAGGAVWMNARCWGRSVSDALYGVDILDEDLNVVFEPFCAGEWAYKRSPYQNRDVLILAARFRLSGGDRAGIQERMAGYRLEREQKGHFRCPSAGSVFKNNPALGKSTGQIIDELGLRGMRSGGAQVADWHGNFIINSGGATSSDIRTLVMAVLSEARARLGIELEPEILFIGDWPGISTSLYSASTVKISR